MKKYGIIYLATNTMNNKMYVGQTTTSLDERKDQHIRGAFTPSSRAYNYAFPRALRKYGTDVFKWELLDIAYSQRELDYLEQYYIADYNTHISNGYGYNMTIGGQGFLGQCHKEEYVLCIELDIVAINPWVASNELPQYLDFTRIPASSTIKKQCEHHKCTGELMDTFYDSVCGMYQGKVLTWRYATQEEINKALYSNLNQIGTYTWYI